MRPPPPWLPSSFETLASLAPQDEGGPRTALLLRLLQREKSDNVIPAARVSRDNRQDKIRVGNGEAAVAHPTSAIPMPLPLSGLLVVSLEQAVAAPMCTCRLADAGARVIKVERPEGDFARYYDKLAVPRARSASSPNSVHSPPPQAGEGADRASGENMSAQGESAYFVWLNRGKESLVLDLAREEDKALLAAIIAKADVFVQNLKPGAIAKPARKIAARASTPRHLFHLRLRRGRPLRAAQGLRHAGAGRIGACLYHRRPRSAGARRRLGLRHRRRHERL
jgi:CoA-transferase family III